MTYRHLTPVGTSMVQKIWDDLNFNGPSRANLLAAQLGLKTSDLTRFLLYMASGKSYYRVKCLHKGRPGPGGAGTWQAALPNPKRRPKFRRT